MFVVYLFGRVRRAASIKVVAGALDPTAAGTGQTSFGLSTIHPKYRKNFQINDIALVQLLNPFVLGRIYKFIALTAFS